MLARLLALAVWLALLGPCAEDRGAVEPDAGADTPGATNQPEPAPQQARPVVQPEDLLEPPPAEDATQADAPDAPDPSSCTAGQTCSQSNATCSVGDTRCACTGTCSGAYMPDRRNVLTWKCREVDPACPESSPAEAAACKPNGLRCDYGHCGGVTATCEARKWTLKFHSPPP